ncbi:MAG: transcriptional repressor [Chloroflexota bacterium]|nr:transcriptional repressor [Chloroflexota bacterium]
MSTYTQMRSTQGRRLILEIIGEAEGHLDANELYRRARQRQPRISLSTVYRSLRLFRELGLVEEHHLDGERRYWEASTRSGHHHMVCLGCGRVEEFRCPLTETLKSRVGAEEGFVVTAAEVRLLGYCGDCQRAMADGQGRGPALERTVTQEG